MDIIGGIPMYIDPLKYIEKKLIEPLVNTAKNTHNSGVNQAKQDVSSAKTVVSSALSGSAGYAISRASSSSPQAAIATAAAVAAGAAITAGVGYVDGAGKYLGLWGK